MSEAAISGVPAAAQKRPKLLYIVHDLTDAAVARRVEMLRAGGGELTVAGFCRATTAPFSVGGAATINLGRTHDARLVQRMISVLLRAAFPGATAGAAKDADVIVARNLESLVIAACVRRPGTRLIYECLDIHRTLLGSSRIHKAVQYIERLLLRQIDGLIVSSPAFLREYFASRLPPQVPATLVENKVLAIDAPVPEASPRPSAPPWRIGWFGNLRCQRSFEQLATLAMEAEGKIEVMIAGRPSAAEFPNFDAMVAAAPGLRFAGAYTPTDLPRLYANCHFAWAIDYFEEGQNSAWLLPNRAYEAPLFGAVPVALAEVETGRHLRALGAGLVIESFAKLRGILSSMDQKTYAALVNQVASIPRDQLVVDRSECVKLVETLVG